MREISVTICVLVFIRKNVNLNKFLYRTYVLSIGTVVDDSNDCGARSNWVILNLVY